MDQVRSVRVRYGLRLVGLAKECSGMGWRAIVRLGMLWTRGSLHRVLVAL